MVLISKEGLTYRRALIWCLFLVIATISATNQPAMAADAETASTQAAQEETRKRSQNKRVCKKVRTTGSRIPQKICMRQKQWDDITEQSQRTAQEMRDASETGIGQ